MPTSLTSCATVMASLKKLVLSSTNVCCCKLNEPGMVPAAKALPLLDFPKNCSSGLASTRTDELFAKALTTSSVVARYLDWKSALNIAVVGLTVPVSIWVGSCPIQAA